MTCDLTKFVIKQCKLQYDKFGREGLIEYCNRKGISFDDVIQLVETGASKEVPATTVVAQESNLYGTIEEDDRSAAEIMGYYTLYPDETFTMKKELEYDVVTATFFDLSYGKIFKNPMSMIPRRGNLLNVELHDLKIDYANKLANFVNSRLEKKVPTISKTDTDNDKWAKLNLILSQSYQIIKYLETLESKDESEYLKNLNLYVKLKFFDDLVVSIPYIKVDFNENPFSMKRYKYVSGKVDHYNGLFSNDEDYSAEKSYSNIVKMMLNYLPETEYINGTLTAKPNTSINKDAFISITQRFKKWLTSKRIEAYRDKPSTISRLILQELSKGENANYGMMMDWWVDDDSTVSRLDADKIRTISKIILGTNENGEFYATLDIRNEFINAINSTVITPWIETVQTLDIEEKTSILESRTLTERRALKEKESLIKNIVAHCIYWSRMQDEYKELLKYDSSEPSQKLIFLSKLLNMDFSSWTVFQLDNEVANPKINAEEILHNLVKGIKNVIDNIDSTKNDSDLINDTSSMIKEFDGTILNFSKVLALQNNSTYKSVIKNAEGNNMPLFQLRHLARLLEEVWLQLDQKTWKDGNPNIIANNLEKIDVVATKSGIDANEDKTSFSKLTFKETITEAIVSHFLYNLKNPTPSISGSNEYRIFIQPNCFADKKSSFPYGFRIDTPWSVYKMGKNRNLIESKLDLKTMLNNIINTNSKEDWKILVNAIRESWNAELRSKWYNILDDYRLVFDPNDEKTNEELIEIVNNYFKKHDLNHIIKLFYNKGVNLIDGVHYTKYKSKETGKSLVSTNKTIEKLIELTDGSKFFDYINRNLDELVKSLYYGSHVDRAWSYIGQDENVLKIFRDNYTDENGNNEWIDNESLSVYQVDYVDGRKGASSCQEVKLTKKNGDVNPIIKAFFLAHNLLGESINRLLYGHYYGHDNKKEFTELEDAISIHVLSQSKRLAIAGATYFPFAQGMKYGVSDTMLCAVIEDETANVMNTNGETDDADSKDGSGNVSPIMSRMENYSLGSAQVGKNKKTIWHFYNERYGTAGMFKWAEYETTNAKRRMSYMAPSSYERLYRKMHSISFSVEQKQSIINNYRTWFGRKILYYKDINTGKTVQIHGISFNLEGDILYARRILNKDGLMSDPIIINNIYDIDQLLGGCWHQEVDDITGNIIYSEKSQDIIYKMVCECDLKHCFISYTSNFSGMKTGRTCVNPESAWHDDSDLMYFEASTSFGGVQMDADHEIAESESTEPTQLIIHISQDGTMSKEVRTIYELLQINIMDSISEYVEALNTGDKERVKEIVSKSIIEAFKTGDKDAISLAQAFVARELKNGGYNIPLSSDAFNAKFMSTVMSDLSKKSAKRHYSGVGAVMNPSYNSIVYYNIGETKYKFEQVVDIIRNESVSFEKMHGFPPTINGNRLSIEDWFRVPMFDNGIINPFMSKPIYTKTDVGEYIESNPIEIGGEYIIWDVDNDGIRSYNRTIKINNLDDLIMYKHRFMLDPFVEITVNELASTNLKGLDIEWTVSRNGTTYSVSQVENPYNLALLHLRESSNKNPRFKLSDTPIYSDNDDFYSYMHDKALGIISDAKQAFIGKYTFDFGKLNYKKLFDSIRNGEMTKYSHKITDEKSLELWSSLNAGDTIRYIYGKSAILIKIKNLVIYEDGNTELEFEYIRDTQVSDNIPTSDLINYIRNKQKSFLNEINAGGSFFGFGEIKSIKTHAAEIMLGKIYAKELGLLPGDQLSDVKDPSFFRKRIEGYYDLTKNPDRGTYDYILFDGTGDDLHVVVGNPPSNFIHNNDYLEQDGIIYKGNKKICSSNGKTFVKYIDSNGNSHNYVYINKDNYQELLNELMNSNKFVYNHYNIRVDNYTLFMQLAGGPISEPNEKTATNLEKKKYQEFVKQIEIEASSARKKLKSFIDSEAKNKFNSFVKTLNFIGVRIPCQGMQSFAPLKVVGFVDVDTNEVYIPVTEQWIEGSDYDIDKYYILGYSLLKNGRFINKYNRDQSNYIKDIVVKNNIVDKILEVISNHKNILNLTSMVSMDDAKALAEKSSLKQSNIDSANPGSIYKLIDENAVGKDSIGIVAVGGKGFSSATYYLNEQIDLIRDALEYGNYDLAREKLNIIARFQNDKIFTLPNLYFSWIHGFLNNPNIYSVPLDIVNILKRINNNWLYQGDSYIYTGQLLNAAADNAKELILKKINAHGEWADMYIAGVMLGYSLEDIAEIMTGYLSDQYILSKSKKVLTSFNKRVETPSPEFENIYKASKELQLLGALAGINQGFPTKLREILKKIRGITYSAESVGITNFDLIKFFSDNEYRDKIIKLHKIIAINPFESIVNHPLLFSQWQAFITAYKVLKISNRSLVYLNQMKNTEDKYFVDEFNYINDKLNGLFVNDWLSRQGGVIRISDPKILSLLYSKDVVEGVYELKDLTWNKTIFKKWMEYYVIPKLKKLYPKNKFLQSLTYDIQRNKREMILFFRVPINMMEIESNEQSRLRYRELTVAFNELSSETFEDKSILDLLYIYNILSNRGFTRSSLNRFFTDMVVTKNKDNIAIDHAEFIDNHSLSEFEEYESLESDEQVYYVEQKEYYQISSSNISKLNVLPDVSANPNIVLYNEDNALETLKKYGLSSDKANLVARTAKAFVFNGKIFINTDLSDRSDLRHELAHIYIGIVKNSNNIEDRNKIMQFYESHKEIIDDIIRKNILTKSVYKPLKNTDLIEEGVAHFMEMSEKNLFEFITFLNLKDKVDSINDALALYKDVTIISDSQKVTTVRNILIKKGYHLESNGKQQEQSILENCI